VVSTLQALRGPQPRVQAVVGADRRAGELVLIGNGRLYGGDVGVFPQANWRDGLLEVRVFERVTFLTLARFGIAWLARKPLSPGVAESLRGERVELSSPGPMPVELDGDSVGLLPATFTVRREALRVIVPG
jgi:diacylglycerol kinase family enzyme